MITNLQETVDLIRNNRMSLPQVRQLFGDAASDAVSVDDWEADYVSSNGELSEYCTVAENSSGGPISTVGLLAYSSDGVTLYCSQYTAGLNGSTIMPSVSTSLFNQADGETILGVLFGSTANGMTYFIERSLTINAV